jgi:hypothetical protein
MQAFLKSGKLPSTSEKTISDDQHIKKRKAAVPWVEK